LDGSIDNNFSAWEKGKLIKSIREEEASKINKSKEE
jgi:hypothetical protein